MKYRRLGGSGLWVSEVCLGIMSYGSKTWRKWVLEEEESRPFIKRALELGINFFDTADMYSHGESERILGKVLKEEQVKREEVVIATKVYFPTSNDPKKNTRGLSRKHILDACDASLKRLQMDYIDLYIIHRFDPETPIEETMCALNDLVRSGKVRYIGASSMYTWQFVEAQYIAEKNGWTKFVSMQNHYNLVYREEEREMIPFCRHSGVGLTPWSPLARGFLAGNRTKKDFEKKDDEVATTRVKTDFASKMYYSDSDFEVVDRVVALAKDKGCSAAQIAMAWILHKPGISSSIFGATKMYQLEEAVKAVDIELTDDEIKNLEEPYVPHKVLGFLTEPKL